MPAPCSRRAARRRAPSPSFETLGKRGIALWRETYPGTVANGTLVVALARDRAELDRFARMTGGHRRLSPAELAELEPDLADRFAGALYYAEEAHLAPEGALRFLLDAVLAEGVALRLGDGEMPRGADLVIDCRGLAAKDELPTLRGVRGERIVVRSREVQSGAARATFCIRAFPSTSSPGATVFI